METANINKSEYDFFISFSTKDVEVVSGIVDVLENVYHAKCWFQTKDSKAEFIDAIMEGIENAKAFLIFVSPDSANSYFVLNEVYHAVEWKQKHDNYAVLPIMVNSDNADFSDSAYKKMHFLLGRLNMLFLNKFSSIEALVTKIFEQTGFEIRDEVLKESLYHASESESLRLKAQNDILINFSNEYFEKAVSSDKMILDIGCANGDYIMSHLDNKEYKSLLGIDIDSEQIERANQAYQSEKNIFVACDALSNDFDSVLSDYLEDNESLGFDVIHISAMLLHLNDPVKLLKTVRRYLKKSGQLFIQDEDDGANIVHPNSRFYDLAFRIWGDSKESGDRHCARKIPEYLSQAGFTRVKLAKCGVSNVGMNSEQQSALWDIYFNYHLWLAVDEDMFYHLDATNRLLEEYKSLYDEHKSKYDDGKTFIQLGFFFYIAQK